MASISSPYESSIADAHLSKRTKLTLEKKKKEKTHFGLFDYLTNSGIWHKLFRIGFTCTVVRLQSVNQYLQFDVTMYRFPYCYRWVNIAPNRQYTEIVHDAATSLDKKKQKQNKNSNVQTEKLFHFDFTTVAMRNVTSVIRFRFPYFDRLLSKELVK